MRRRERQLVHLTVDLAILTVRENILQVLVIERANEPYQGQAALPGGFLRPGEHLRRAAERELDEETGLDGTALHLEQLAVYDHTKILDDAVERARTRLEFTTLAAAFCGPAFTIGDLRKVYEVVWNTPLDPRNFSRKVAHTEGFIEPTGTKRNPDTGRPAALYQRGPAQTLNPPLLRATTTA